MNQNPVPLTYDWDTERGKARWALTAAFFAGVSNVSTAKTTSTTTTPSSTTSRATTSGSTKSSTTMSSSTQQNAGFGYGVGLLVEVKGGFQAGAVLGFDSIGSGQGFQYNNKPWIALQLGYSFSQSSGEQ